MNRLKSKANNQLRRASRVRKTVSKNTELPRLSVVISNRHISAQIIDDSQNKTLVASTSTGKNSKSTMTETAKTVGADIAKKAKSKKLDKVKFDRGAKLYHGRIKAFAESAREGGLKF